MQLRSVQGFIWGVMPGKFLISHRIALPYLQTIARHRFDSVQQLAPAHASLESIARSAISGKAVLAGSVDLITETLGMFAASPAYFSSSRFPHLIQNFYRKCCLVLWKETSVMLLNHLRRIN